MGYTVEEAVRITGVPEGEIRELAQLIGTAKTAIIQPSNGLSHHANGLPSHRAVICLNALTGNVNKPGTIVPTFETFADMAAGFRTREDEFVEERFPRNARPKIGSARFPLWSEMLPEAQGMDLVRQWEKGEPYPIRAHLCPWRQQPYVPGVLQTAGNGGRSGLCGSNRFVLDRFLPVRRYCHACLYLL